MNKNASNRLILDNLPFPVSVNKMYRIYKGRRYLSPDARRYKNAVILLCKKNMEQQKFRKIDNGKGVCIEANFYPPTNSSDLDNLNKILLDAFESTGVFSNDNQVVKLVTQKIVPKFKHNGFVDAVIYESEIKYY